MYRETSRTVIRDCMAEDAVEFYGILGSEEAKQCLHRPGTDWFHTSRRDVHERGRICNRGLSMPRNSGRRRAAR